MSLTDEDDDDSGNEERPNLDEAESRTSPIVIDLDGDGVETSACSRDRYFDHDGNGMRESTAWIGADDGFLVRDLNQDGAITTRSAARRVGNECVSRCRSRCSQYE